ADEDRSRQRAMTRAATLLLLRLLGGAIDFRTGLLCLGAGTTSIAVGNDDLVNQILAERAIEHRIGHRQLIGATVDIEFHDQTPLLVGRTITSPPGAPGTAPRTAIRPRSASTFTTRRFCVVWVT